MIFTIKQEDMRYKARFVMNGNVIDASDYVKYSSTVNSLSVRLLFIVLKVKLCPGTECQEIKPSTNDKGNEQASEKDTVPNITWKSG